MQNYQYHKIPNYWKIGKGPTQYKRSSIGHLFKRTITILRDPKRLTLPHPHIFTPESVNMSQKRRVFNKHSHKESFFSVNPLQLAR